MADQAQSLQDQAADINALLERIDRLVGQGAPRGALGERLASLTHRIADATSRITVEIEAADRDLASASDVVLAACAEAASQLESASEAAAGATQALSSAVEEGFSQFESSLQGASSELTDAANASTEYVKEASETFEQHAKQLADTAERDVEGLLADSQQRYDGAATGVVSRLDQRLHRVMQLRSDIEGTLKDLEKTFQVFGSSMQATQTGLNVTAGTLQDVVSIFTDIA